MGTVKLSCQKICVVADTLTGLHVLAPAAEDLIGTLPQFLRNNGRNDFPRLILEHDPILGRQELLILREHVDNLDLLAHIIPLVLGI